MKMTILEEVFNRYKDLWLSRNISGYKGPCYYRFVKVELHNTEIEMIRYYPKTHKWQYDYAAKIEYLSKLEIVDDENLTSKLDAEYAKFLLTKKDNMYGR